MIDIVDSGWLRVERGPEAGRSQGLGSGVRGLGKCLARVKGHGANIQRSTFDAEHSTNAGYPAESNQIQPNQGKSRCCFICAGRIRLRQGYGGTGWQAFRVRSNHQFSWFHTLSHEFTSFHMVSHYFLKKFMRGTGCGQGWKMDFRLRQGYCRTAIGRDRSVFAALRRDRGKNSD